MPLVEAGTLWQSFKYLQIGQSRGLQTPRVSKYQEVFFEIRPRLVEGIPQRLLR